jgi:hypothetical protein
MKTRNLQPPRLLLFLGAACGLALWVTAERAAATRIAAIGSDPSMIQATDSPLARHRSPRRHGTLSMPYFSFARSLRPGS